MYHWISNKMFLRAKPIEPCSECGNLQVLYSRPFGEEKPPICYNCNVKRRSYMSTMFDYGFNLPQIYDQQSLYEYFVDYSLSIKEKYELRIKQKDEEIKQMKNYLKNLVNLKILEFNYDRENIKI